MLGSRFANSDMEGPKWGLEGSNCGKHARSFQGYEERIKTKESTKIGTLKWFWRELSKVLK